MPVTRHLLMPDTDHSQPAGASELLTGGVGAAQAQASRGRHVQPAVNKSPIRSYNVSACCLSGCAKSEELMSNGHHGIASK